MKWFCLTCMKNHTSVEDVDACQRHRSNSSHTLSPEDIRAALDWARDHDIKISAEK